MRLLGGLTAMKMFVGVAVFFWLICGAVGAWMLDDLDPEHWQMIAKGPLTLVKAFNETSVPYPNTG